MENVKKLKEVGILCNVDGKTFHLFTKNTWIIDYCDSCHITNNDTGFYGITKINELMKGRQAIFPQPIKVSFA